jgi:hypothetical protein
VCRVGARGGCVCRVGARGGCVCRVGARGGCVCRVGARGGRDVQSERAAESKQLSREKTMAH